MARQIVDPRMLDHLGDLFPSKVTIQFNAPFSDDVETGGEELPRWNDLPDHVDLDCRLSPSGGKEVRNERQSYNVSTHFITIKGHFPSITANMRALIGSQAYNILLVQADGQSVVTKLTVEVVA
ncbi:MAG: hypothetical protein DWQ07_12755 [Chloroflexi bacterium]|nr:MAG: hypothetical protein DWQ07_12755 [Chloroflexota bacterium]MBL1196909.1 hypothetical protein [Chloroflexota bacterium]NOH14205.1 hypothetical protein [Chloroflexota bacterium]